MMLVILSQCSFAAKHIYFLYYDVRFIYYLYLGWCSDISVSLLSYLSYIKNLQRKAFYSTVSANRKTPGTLQ